MKIKFDLSDEARLDAYYLLQLRKLLRSDSVECLHEKKDFNVFLNDIARYAFENYLKIEIDISKAELLEGSELLCREG